MAKDGTNRGGRRVRAGTKPDALVEKIADKRSAKVLEPIDFDIDDSFETDDLIDMCVGLSMMCYKIRKPHLLVYS